MTIFPTDENQVSDTLFEQAFKEELDPKMSLEKYRHVAFILSVLQNSTTVLVDLKSKAKYVYHGGLSLHIGVAEEKTGSTQGSADTDNIVPHLHPDDLKTKHLMELRLFHFLKNKTLKERLNYHIILGVRILNKEKQYIPVELKIFYASSTDSIQLILYQYSFSISTERLLPPVIINSGNGIILPNNSLKTQKILTKREIEILKEIAVGKASKEISQILFISKNTVDRHRQNIMEKLRVKSAIEACHIANMMGII
ncbi:response regulator transcription factor [Chryseobacterium gleum]|uniref:response regulator transcription factor n=1 Tax=Chryseobacterium gleum TaxID=250 RepID=UPI00289F343B|nr:helix-turn-helix transcriptional regulator [Chryseobacterium gleum]